MAGTTAPDWAAATEVAQGLGLNTRRLVDRQDAPAAIRWALEQSRANNGVTALSYYELAVMLGHREAKVTAGARLDWNDLLRAVEKLAGAVRAKIADEEAAEKAAAEERAAAEKAAEKEAAAVVSDDDGAAAPVN